MGENNDQAKFKEISDLISGALNILVRDESNRWYT